MGCKSINSWTFFGLLVAFFDLFIAYILLCIAAFAFFPSKVLSFLETHVQSGFFGYQNSNFCLQKLLFDWPVRKIYSVEELVNSRFPFDLVSYKDHSCNPMVEGVRDRRIGNAFGELNGEASSSSISGPMLQSYVDRESGIDAKGRKIVNQKQKSVFRRRRRALGYGRASSAVFSNSTRSVGIVSDGSEMGSEISESLDSVSGFEDGHFDYGNAQKGIRLGERFHRDFEFSGPDEKGKGIDKDSSSVENFPRNAEDNLGGVVNDANVITMLRQALEEEKAAHVALYQELEKERAAAATAANEALAMISRLHEDKALIVMEARQYQRMIDEKFDYDEEEMNILKEILIRRETEIHFLEKEVEAYHEMNFPADDQLEADGNLSYKTNSGGEKFSLSIDSNENPLLMPQQSENSKSIGEKETTTANWSSYEQRQTLLHGEENALGQCELISDLSTSQKTINLSENEKATRDTWLMPQGMKADQTYGGIGEEETKENGKCCNPDNSIPDAESPVYDVHVVDDKIVIWNDNGGKECEPLNNDISDSGVRGCKLSNDCPCTSMAGSQQDGHERSLDINSRLPLLVNSRYKTSSVDLQRSSSSAVDIERLKVDTEVEWLREKLRMVQEEKEKLNFSVEQRERVNTHLKLVEEIVNQLREIQLLRGPARHTSLPLPSSKVNLKRRRCRSVSLEAFKSA